MPEAVADLLREVLPFTIGVFAPPGWDRSYSECFGFTLEEIYEEGARSFESKLRAAGLPLEDLPGPVPYPIDLPPRERALRGMALLQSGILGQKNGPPARDPETMALLFDTVRRGVDFRTAPEGPLTVQWDFTDAEAWHMRLDNGSTAVAPGRVEAPDIVFRARYEDFVDVVGGRLDPRRAMATGRLRPRGSLRTLWSARGLFVAALVREPCRESRCEVMPCGPGFAPTAVTCTRLSLKSVSEPRPPSRPSGATTSAPSRAVSRARAVIGPTEPSSTSSPEGSSTGRRRSWEGSAAASSCSLTVAWPAELRRGAW